MFTQTSSVPVEHGKLAYTYIPSTDSKPTVLFLHATVADQSMWTPQMSYLSKTHSVLRCDLRGAGKTFNDPQAPPDATYSPVEDVIALLDHLKVNKVVIVGASAGGMVAMDVAVNHPHRVVGVVHVCSAVNGLDEPEYDEAETGTDVEKEVFARLMAAYVAKDYATLTTVNVEMWADGCGQPHGRSGDVGKKMERMMTDNFANHEQKGELVVARRHPVTSTASRIAEIQCPVLVITGGYDTTPTQRAGTWVAKNVPRAETFHFEKCAHMPSMEEPDEFNILVERFLNKL
ncbi:hypothetical protein PhCBS80983_g01918 [Powellomyces hirtus]|uniref:AB hydrolase-1 domain-containing protein n=1 Tax=Powellomyces hirtus TaxID=109895 RepID=A0A507E8R3_9FUNG|nr:hypothetical protein PhCBS80983_g01918 [Powellomyces hirtus]